MRELSLVRLGAAALVIAATAGIAAADPVQLRMATPGADGGAWIRVLGKGAAEIAARTKNRVRVKYEAGGVHGDERDIVRKIELGQLDGAALTSTGLSMIDESIRVLELPRMYATVDEFDYVAERMWPYFQKKFEAKGYRLDARGEVGSVHFVSKSEINSLADLKHAKVWLDPSDPIVRNLYKKLDVAGVPLGIPEVEPALTTGRINAAYGSPLAAVALQWTTKINAMTSLPLSLAIGGTVTKLDALKEVSRADQAVLIKVARSLSTTLRAQFRKENESARKELEGKGVKVTTPSAEMIGDFDKAATAVWSDLTDRAFSKAELEMVLKLRDEYRAKNPAK